MNKILLTLKAYSSLMNSVNIVIIYTDDFTLEPSLKPPIEIDGLLHKAYELYTKDRTIPVLLTDIEHKKLISFLAARGHYFT